MVMNKHF